MNNVLNCRTKKIVTNRLNIIQLADEDKAFKLTKKPNRSYSRVYAKSLFGVNIRKLWHFMSKPIKHCLIVRKLSKWKMSSFYSQLKNNFEKRMRNLYTDTNMLFFSFSWTIYEERWIKSNS